MSHHEQTIVTGEVSDIFAHRFVVKTATGTILADLGPKGAEQIRLKLGDQVELTGEMKPSELKVHSIAKGNTRPVIIDHPQKPPHEPHHKHHEDADPKPALQTAKANGFKVLGRPRRKPKHFEILGRDAAGDLLELHIELDGTLHKTRPIEDGDPKWAAEIQAVM